jgi:phospholipid/cholesterol/gamma-HCH transport system substrate-binding protein
VAGVKVGEVTGVTLERDHVKVTFRARDVWLGNRTVAAVRIKTLLGQKNLALDPAGDAPLDPNTPIPTDRTVTPYDVTDAFGDLAKTTGDIDTDQLARSFSTLAEVFSSTTPQDIKSTLDGLAALSKTISSRDQELRTLLHNTGAISRTVADHNDQFAALIKDGGALLAEFTSRRDAVNRLLAGTRDLSHQLAGIVADNKDTLGPALDQLDHVTDVLQRNQDNLNRSLQLAGPFYRLVGNAVGNGRWIDTYICGLVPGNQPGCLPPKIRGN